MKNYNFRKIKAINVFKAMVKLVTVATVDNISK